MKTEQRSERETVRFLVGQIRHSESQAKFWFSQRHNWSEDGGGYAHARKNFLIRLREIHYWRAKLVKSSERLVKLYKDS